MKIAKCYVFLDIRQRGSQFLMLENSTNLLQKFQRQELLIFQKNSTQCVLEKNNIEGHVSVVYGEGNSIKDNEINDGSILLTDTDEVNNTLIENNTLNNSYIKSTVNTGTLIINNKVTNGYIDFSFCNGAVVGNSITCSGSRLDFGILIYGDDQCGDDDYNVFLLNNNVSGNYNDYTLISSYKHLNVSNSSSEYNSYLAGWSA